MSLLFFLHIFLMALGAICFVISLIIVLNRKRFKQKWLFHHKRLNLLGLYSMLTGFLFIFIYVFSYGGTHFSNVHSRFGVATLFLLTLTVILMLLSMKKKKKALMKWHPWEGRISFVFLLITLSLGLFLVL